MQFFTKQINPKSLFSLQSEQQDERNKNQYQDFVYN